MKNFRTIFDCFVIETVLSFLFSLVLHFLKDPNAILLLKISIISLVVTLVLGGLGFMMKWFSMPVEEF